MKLRLMFKQIERQHFSDPIHYNEYHLDMFRIFSRMRRNFCCLIVLWWVLKVECIFVRKGHDTYECSNYYVTYNTSLELKYNKNTPMEKVLVFRKIRIGMIVILPFISTGNEIF